MAAGDGCGCFLNFSELFWDCVPDPDGSGIKGSVFKHDRDRGII